jgi:hypothetical protein
MLEQFFKDSLITPSIKASINGIPFAVCFREQSPLRSRTSYPKNGFKESRKKQGRFWVKK